ncbi:MAG: signal peptidase II [Clostridia bacterium]|nr:signal peptidase II [Clostridia bacterium]
MKKLKFSQYVIYSTIILIGIWLDQLTKWLAVKFLSPIETQPLIKGVLHLTYVENRGAAFGMLADHRWIFIVVSTVTILGMGFALYAGFMENKLYTVATAMIISGGIGNMIDRILLGYVVDFIDFRLINFAVFNGADSFVCVGAGLLVLALVTDIVKEQKSKKRSS